jgi:protein TonB
VFALIESCPEQRPRSGWTGRIASFAVHSFLITAALAFTRHVAADGPPKAEPPIPIVWPLPGPTPAVPTGSDPGTAPVTDAPRPLPIVAPVVVPSDIPPPGDPVTAPGIPDPVPAPLAIHPGQPGTLPIGTAPRDARFVEELPVLISHPEIRYPEVLRQAGIEGHVMIETVLDTLGRAEPSLTRVAAGVNDLFNREALSVVLASRYRPARVSGRPVRVRVQVPVNFSLHP